MLNWRKHKLKSRLPGEISIKDRNGMDISEAEDVKKRWQEYREKLYKERCQ